MAIKSKLSLSSLSELKSALQTKKISSVELTQQCFKILSQSQLNAYISVLEDSALLEAKQSDERLNSGKILSILDGIPYSLKDLFVTKGIRTTAASRYLSQYIPPFDGYVSETLKNAGGVCIGKNNCDEFGMGSTNENSAFGPVLNPFDSSKVAGGSSGGSAAAVAEGSCVFSVGTDTGGSARLPAHFCNVVGYRPTYGTISRYGQIAYASSLDQASVLANSVTDAALITEILSTSDKRDQTKAVFDLKGFGASIENLKKTTELKQKTLSWSPQLLEGVDSDVENNFRVFLKQAAANGVSIKEIELPTLKHAISAYYIIATSEASTNLARYDGIHYGPKLNQEKSNTSNMSALEQSYFQSRSFGFGDEVKKRIMLGTFNLSAGYHDAYYTKACQVRRLIADELGKIFSQSSALLLPTCASSAFELGGSKKASSLQMYLNDIYTVSANLIGGPAVCLPTGMGPRSLPIGLQLMGAPFEDQKLLELAKELELAWSNRS